MRAARQTLSIVDAIAIIVGIVVGAGIFKTPSIVAANTGSEAAFLIAWLFGGAISLVGALCYAELASAYPSEGGDFHYFSLSFGRSVAFLFAWARLAVIQTGSIAILAFVFGDYATQLMSLGAQSTAIYAGTAIILLTALNSFGVKQGTLTQKILTGVKVLGLLSVVLIGFFLAGSNPPTALNMPNGSFGLAMVFVLLTYGGWNEIAFASAEFQDVRRNMLKALLWGIAIITAVFLLVNVAYLRGLGLEGTARSDVVAADLIKAALGESGAKFISLLIAVSSLGAASGTIFTGARTNYALGRSFRPLRFMGRWHAKNTPLGALVVQGAIALLMVAFGAVERRGFETTVEYTAPVFWFFFLLSGISLIVLRTTDPNTPRPFRVPIYPVVPLLFCSASAYMLWSSLAYTNVGGLVGVLVLMIGAFVLLLARLLRKEQWAGERGQE
ncbi:MAG: APC family permease [Pyrinomonadaceae bacterium]